MIPFEVVKWSDRALAFWYLSGIPFLGAVVTFFGALLDMNSFVLFGIILGVWAVLVAVSIYCMRRETLAYNGMFTDDDA